MKGFIPGLVIFVFLLVGCAGSPLLISNLSYERLKSVNAYSLCNAYAVSPTDSIRVEIQRRGIVPLYEWDLINRKRINIGMSEFGLVCSWGYPFISGRVNKSIGSWGTHKQYVYRACRGCSGTYVYVENGFVTSWQN